MDNLVKNPSPRLLTVDDIRRLLRAECHKLGSQAAWASFAGFSPPFVAMVLNGRKLPSRRMCALLGVQPVTRYRRQEV